MGYIFYKIEVPQISQTGFHTRYDAPYNMIYRLKQLKCSTIKYTNKIVTYSIFIRKAQNSAPQAITNRLPLTIAPLSQLWCYYTLGSFYAAKNETIYGIHLSIGKITPSISYLNCLLKLVNNREFLITKMETLVCIFHKLGTLQLMDLFIIGNLQLFVTDFKYFQLQCFSLFVYVNVVTKYFFILLGLRSTVMAGLIGITLEKLFKRRRINNFGRNRNLLQSHLMKFIWRQRYRYRNNIRKSSAFLNLVLQKREKCFLLSYERN